MKVDSKNDSPQAASSDNSPSSQRPRRNVMAKSLDYNNGLLWKEEKDLKKALYASLNENRRSKILDSGEWETSGDITGPNARYRQFQRPGQNGVGNRDESPKRAKVHAQRKFAQGSTPNSPAVTPVKILQTSNVASDLLPCRRPKTEDFLTFLCLRGTPLLPPALDFLNQGAHGDSESSRSSSPELGKADISGIKDEQLSKFTGLHEKNPYKASLVDRLTPVKQPVGRTWVSKRERGSITGSENGDMYNESSIESSGKEKSAPLTHKRKLLTRDSFTRTKQATLNPESLPRSNSTSGRLKNSSKLTSVGQLREKYKQQRLAKEKQTSKSKDTRRNTSKDNSQEDKKTKRRGNRHKSARLTVTSSSRNSRFTSQGMQTRLKLVTNKQKPIRSARLRGESLPSVLSPVNPEPQGITPHLRKAKLVPPIVDFDSESDFEAESVLVSPKPVTKESKTEENKAKFQPKTTTLRSTASSKKFQEWRDRLRAKNSTSLKCVSNRKQRTSDQSREVTKKIFTSSSKVLRSATSKAVTRKTVRQLEKFAKPVARPQQRRQVPQVFKVSRPVTRSIGKPTELTEALERPRTRNSSGINGRSLRQRNISGNSVSSVKSQKNTKGKRITQKSEIEYFDNLPLTIGVFSQAVKPLTEVSKSKGKKGVKKREEGIKENTVKKDGNEIEDKYMESSTSILTKKTEKNVTKMNKVEKEVKEQRKEKNNQEPKNMKEETLRLVSKKQKNLQRDSKVKSDKAEIRISEDKKSEGVSPSESCPSDEYKPQTKKKEKAKIHLESTGCQSSESVEVISSYKKEPKFLEEEKQQFKKKDKTKPQIDSLDNQLSVTLEVKESSEKDHHVLEESKPQIKKREKKSGESGPQSSLSLDVVTSLEMEPPKKKKKLVPLKESNKSSKHVISSKSLKKSEKKEKHVSCRDLESKKSCEKYESFDINSDNRIEVSKKHPKKSEGKYHEKKLGKSGNKEEKRKKLKKSKKESKHFSESHKKYGIITKDKLSKKLKKRKLKDKEKYKSNLKTDSSIKKSERKNQTLECEKQLQIKKESDWSIKGDSIEVPSNTRNVQLVASQRSGTYNNTDDTAAAASYIIENMSEGDHAIAEMTGEMAHTIPNDLIFGNSDEIQGLMTSDFSGVFDDSFPAGAILLTTTRETLTHVPYHFIQDFSPAKTVADASTNTCEEDILATLSESLEKIEDISVGTQTTTPAVSPEPVTQLAESLITSTESISNQTQTSSSIRTKTTLSPKIGHPGTPVGTSTVKRKLKLVGANKKQKSDAKKVTWKKEPFPMESDPPKMVEAPVYHPTAEEFQDPLEFIEKIRPEAEKYGICKIIPPDSFKPECKVNDDMRFIAHNQYVHKVLYRWGPNVQHVSCIKKTLKVQGVSLEHAPLIGGVELDLSKLYNTVQHFGGLKQVIEKKKWQRVADAMHIPKAAQDRVTKLYDAYCKYIVPYDTLPAEEKQKLEELVISEHNRYVQKRREIEEAGEDDSEEENIDCVAKGRSMSLSGFYRIARNTMAMYYKHEPSPDEVENDYWKHVKERESHIVVHAGNIDSSVYGSGFPCTRNSPFAKHPWNLKILTNSQGSILKCMGPVSGVTIPTLHVGMLFTTGCWYRDPHCLPWLEYLHTGASKIWYSIPAYQTENFCSAMKKIMPEFCTNNPIWLSSDTAMIPPDLLVEHGASLSRTVQDSGQFIVIFPGVFTSTICCGYCVSESVYFATLDWLDLAEKAFMDIRNSCEPPAFSLERLLCCIANDGRTQIETLQKILPMIDHIREQTLKLRKQLYDLGLKTSERLPLVEVRDKKRRPRSTEDESEQECEVCRAHCYISMVVNTQEDSVYCLDHAIQHVQKKKNLRFSKLMYTYDQINQLVKQHGKL
ncbi:jumonji, AT rich interactive domain 2 isoform X2 [Tachypleus tridentatus]|uniref:jumonji, AT rich interactive domain 2 isoform X2 n=1 Tax=Tachypleus tridentatus TaxID=6853 RepID=UPI003FCFDF46